MNKIILFLCLAIFVQGQLKIYEGSSQVKGIFQSGIKYSQAEFGHYTHNKQFIGQLVKGSPINGCNIQNVTEHKVDEHNKSPFLLVERGDCTFVTKAKFGQLYGAKLLIVMDNVYERTSYVNMADDGHGFYGLSIPTILIGKWDGQQLLHSLERDENITLSIQFDTIKQSNTKYVFYLTTANRQSSRLVRDFQPYYEKLKKHVSFEPRYALWTNVASRLSNFTLPNPSACVSQGRYCSQRPGDERMATGQDFVLEDLRQLCIWKHEPQNWFQYIQLFDNECVDYVDMKVCGTIQMNQLGINYLQIESCIENSFIKSHKQQQMADYNTDDNTLLKEQLEMYNKQSVYYTPSVYVNGLEHKGRLNASDILETICASTDHPLPPCISYTTDKFQLQPQGQFATVVSIVIPILFIFFLLMLVCYRRMVKREMSQQVNTQVNQMLNQYMAFKENKPQDSMDIKV